MGSPCSKCTQLRQLDLVHVDGAQPDRAGSQAVFSHTQDRLKPGRPTTNHFGKPLAMVSQRCLKAGLDCDNMVAAASARSRLPASQS